jgi:hypothetical protein
MIARGGAATLALGMIVAAGITAVGAWRARGATSGRQMALSEPSLSEAAIDSASDRNRGIAIAAEPAIAQEAVTTEPGADASNTPAIQTTAMHALAPVIPVGRTMLRDTMVAERMGDTVRVSFDLLLSRTRRPEKFEAIMRATLPQVYGAVADSALQSLPEGTVARAGDLLATLPERGLRIPAAGGTTIAVWPETRAGRDGPLVVAYRALASR